MDHLAIEPHFAIGNKASTRGGEEGAAPADFSHDEKEVVKNARFPKSVRPSSPILKTMVKGGRAQDKTFADSR